MPHTAFFAKDKFGLTTTSASITAVGNSPDAPYTNALDDRPRLSWQALSPGLWSSPVTFIDIDEGAGAVSVTLPANVGDQHTWRGVFTAWLNASSLAQTYSVDYNLATSKMSISSSGSFEILWASGAHGGASGDNPRQWLGWPKTAADTGSAAIHEAPERRYGTELFVALDLGSPKDVDALALVLHAGPLADFFDPAKHSVKVYGASSMLSTSGREAWEAGAATNLNFSVRPSEDQNVIQVAHDNTGATMTHQFWAFSWRFFDEEPRHEVGLLKALEKFASTTRQITELAGHGLVDPTPRLGIGNYYPSQSLLRWIAPLNFDAWEASDYRATVQRVVREGRSRGLLWSLRWDEIISGLRAPEDEADVGFLLWGSISNYGQGTYSGAGSSDYISGELTIEQVR